MNQYAIFTLIWMNVAIPINAASAQMIAGLMGVIGQPFEQAAIAYFIITALIAAYSPDEEAYTKFFKQLALAAVVFTLATNAGTFNYYVANLVQGTVNTISTAIAGAFNQGGPLNANGFDVIGTRAFAVGLGAFKNLPWYSLKVVPLGIVVAAYWFLSFAAIVVMFSVYLVSYVLTALLIGVGPVFVALYFFPYTRGWFDGWLQNLMTGVLVQIFTSALGSMFIFVIGNVLTLAATGMGNNVQLGAVDGGIVIGEIMMLVVTALACLIFGILSVVIIQTAMSIAGGVHSEATRLTRIAQGEVIPGGSGRGQVAGGGAPGSIGASGGANPSSSTPSGGSPLGQPQRQYAFNRTVGSAP